MYIFALNSFLCNTNGTVVMLNDLRSGGYIAFQLKASGEIDTDLSLILSCSLTARVGYLADSFLSYVESLDLKFQASDSSCLFNHWEIQS